MNTTTVSVLVSWYNNNKQVKIIHLHSPQIENTLTESRVHSQNAINKLS